MQDPRRDVRTVIRQLVCRPTLQQQAEALRTFFTPDVQFYHFYINISRGRSDLTAIYQMADVLVNYQTVQFHDIVFDDSPPAATLCVHITVYVRPWQTFYSERKLVFFTLLELQDHSTQDGKQVKLIKVQRDYFDISPTIGMLPIVDTVINSWTTRAVIGRAIAMLVRSLRYVFSPKQSEYMY